MKNAKKLLATALSVALVIGCFVSASAAETVQTSGGTGETTVVLTAEAATFSVTVPTSIPIRVNADGSVTCPDNVEILNESTAAVQVTKIDMKDGAWSLVPFTTDMSQERVDSKKLGFQMTAGEDVVATAATGDQTIAHAKGEWLMAEKDAVLPIECEAVASAVSTAITDTDAQAAASIVFTIGWATVE